MQNHIAEIASYKTENFNVPSHKIAFSEWNNEGREVLVCLHSLIANSHDFDFLAEAISKDLRVIAVDMPGRGDSSWFEDKSLYNYEVYIADLLALLKSLNIEKMHVLGSSMGGIMGMILASNHPEMIKSLILNDIGPEIPGKALAKIRKYLAISPPFPHLELAKRHLQMVFKNFGIEGEGFWSHVVKYYTFKKDDGNYYLKYDPQIANTFSVNMENPEDVIFWELWDKITCDTLLIHGADSDILLQKTVDKMNLRHNMDLYVVHEAGHAPALFDTKEINYIHTWLKNILQNS
ncbi:MAG UNVERIFIED_CONTAM: alpha/beta hydrolase [Planctomycetaceae bacterium]|jgi:pimeloyl-ACP methyl ester carboxylesterase